MDMTISNLVLMRGARTKSSLASDSSANRALAVCGEQVVCPLGAA